jgi:hypothetical protein
MTKIAVEQFASDPTVAYSAYDSTKLVLGPQIYQNTSSNPNFVGPLVPAVARPAEASTGLTISFPIVIEYNKISYEEDVITCVSPAEIQVKVDGGFKFDALICISSIEHDGLNRYGDPLNPNGDLDSMKIFKGYLKRDGLLYLSCPVGIDSVVWNWHRIYGQKRLPLLFSGWSLVDSFGFSDSHLQRNVEKGWNEKLPTGLPVFSRYPSFEPLFVLKNDGLGLLENYE